MDMDAIEAIRGRRSINFFDPEYRLPRETLLELLELANLAPSSFNLQPWEVVAVLTPEGTKRLRACAFGQPKVEEASAVLIVVGDPGALEAHIDPVLDRMVELGYLPPEGREKTRPMPFRLYGELDSLSRKLFAAKNAALFAMNLMVAARGLGLETHPMDGFDEAQVKEAFRIAPEKLVPLLVAVGRLKPGITLLPRGLRFPVTRFARFDDE
jgi:nitroreductase